MVGFTWDTCVGWNLPGFMGTILFSFDVMAFKCPFPVGTFFPFKLPVMLLTNLNIKFPEFVRDGLEKC